MRQGSERNESETCLGAAEFLIPLLVHLRKSHQTQLCDQNGTI